MDEFDDQIDDELGEEEWKDASYENTVFLVDSRTMMLNAAGLEAEGYRAEDTYMDLALKSIEELMKQHIIGNPKDRMAVVFYSSRIAQNTSGWPNVHVFHPLEELTASSIRNIQALIGEKFKEDIGSHDDDLAESLRDGLFTASQMLLGASTKAARRVMIFTTAEDPCPDDSDGKEKILNRAENLKEAHVEVQLFNLTTVTQKFSMEFWKQIVSNPDDDLGGQSADAEPLRLEDLEMNVRRKIYKKRAVASIFWSFGPDIRLAVKLYNLISKATPSKHVSVDLRTSSLIRIAGSHICNDTGAPLEKIEKFVFPKKEAASPKLPQLLFTAEQRQAIRGNAKAGISLIGFKPLDRLRNYHQLRTSTFMYPDEGRAPGSATLFIALHDRMLALGVFALCSVVRTRASEVRLAAVIAQQEAVDSYGQQVQPPGMNIIYLPFADDIRAPEKDGSFMGTDSHQPAGEEQIDAAEKLLNKLHLQDFQPGMVPNPHLQRHYQVIEALAFEEEPPEFGEKDDLTMPDNENMVQEAEKELLSFRDAIYGEGNEGPKNEKKRKSASDADKTAADIDFKDLASKKKLSGLTLPPLKDFCRRNHLSSNGKKADIIERIEQHFES